MKKLITILLLFVLTVTCAGCGSTPTPAPSAPAAPSEPVPAEMPEQAAEQETEKAAPPEEMETASVPEPENAALVVYFSATGTTRGIAEKIASLTGSELVEILPAQPYTTEDLNYNDHTTRATVEQNTPEARPEIANDISLEGYTTVYLGYPIWWGQAPRIMSTFVESHDFTGITVIPFCTSGSSGAGRTGETLGEQAGTGTFLSSTRFSASVSDADLQSWIDSRN